MSEINKNNLKHWLSYIPLVAFFFFFTEKNISKDFKKHINYGMILFWFYIVWTILLKLFFLYILLPFLVIFYFLAWLYLWLKAYSWENIDVEILDNIEETISNNIGK